MENAPNTTNKEKAQSREIIIVGAGPAGLATALELKRLGKTDILVLESQEFPRDKCCAGYVTSKTVKVYKEYGLDVMGECDYHLIDDFNILYKNQKRQTIINKCLYTNRIINRGELDHGFFKLAKAAGIEIAERSAVSSIDVDESLVKTIAGDYFRYEYLVFADGTSGFGSKLQAPKNRNIAMQILFQADIEDKIDIHFGISKRGYGWVSSYHGNVNIGLTDIYDKDINYRDLFGEFVKTLGMDIPLDNLYAAFTPIGVGEPIINKNIYYAGDALGACDPFTLSGLRYGLESGRAAAHSIVENKPEIYNLFAKSLKRRFFITRSMQRVFYLGPILFMVFNIGCRFFGRMISSVFNNFFVNKK